MALAGVLAFVGCGKSEADKNREKREAGCVNNLKQMGTALITYDNDYKKFPEKSGVAGLEELRSTQLDESRSFVCPSTLLTPAADGEKLTKDNCSYLYFAGLPTESSLSLPIVMDLPGNHEKVIHYLRTDTSVGSVKCKGKISAVEAVYLILGKKSGFTEDEQKIVDQAKAWDEGK